MEANKKESTLFAVALVLVGCAQSPSSIEARHIPSVKYQDHTCMQMSERLQLVEARLDALIPIQDSASSVDEVMLPVGLVALWGAPLLFMSGGAHQEELSILKGEINAIEHSAKEKGCKEIVEYIHSQRVAAEIGK